MRQAVLRVRVWNETRSLADLPPKELADVLDDAFNVNQSASKSAESSRLSDADVKHSSLECAIDVDSLVRDAILIRTKALEQGWLSRKSSKALSVLEKGKAH